jgi:DNA repair protein RecO (recombination protein O)
VRRSQQFDAVILRAHDVGEADRFCVLLTREAGRMAARARGVRKPGSRMGGSLLPFRRVRVEIGGETHPHVLSAADAGPIPSTEFPAFSRMSRGVELLLALTHDHDPMPEIFDATVRFLAACADTARDPYPAYAVRLLSLLGILPAEDDDPRFARLGKATRAFVLAAAGLSGEGTAPAPDERELDAFLRSVLVDHLPRELKAERIAR